MEMLVQTKIFINVNQCGLDLKDGTLHVQIKQLLSSFSSAFDLFGQHEIVVAVSFIC